MLDVVAALAAGYLLGSLPFAEWIARGRGATIFEIGSGNMGAMNTARNIGFGPGALVLLLDAAKGAAATGAGLLLARSQVAPQGSAAWLLPALAAGLGAILGHAFSLYIGFRGGKGLAAAFGVSLPLYPLGGLLGAGALIVLTLALRHRSGLAAVIAVAVYPALALASQLARGRGTSASWAIAAGVASISVVVLYRHYLAFRRERARVR